MKKTLFILLTLLLVSCDEKQDKIKEPIPITKEAEANIEELLSQEIIDVVQVKKLLPNGKIVPMEYLTQFVDEEIEKIEKTTPYTNDSINYEKLYQLYILGFNLPNAQDYYKEELEKDDPNFYLLGTYLLYGANIDTLNSKGEDITKLKDKDHITILYASCRSGYTDLVKKLIEKNMDINLEEIRGFSNMNASLFSKSENKKDIINLLLKAGFNLEKQGLNPLILESALGSKENIEKLLDNETNVDKKSKKGMTPLMFASFDNRKEVVESLIRAGAQVNEKNENDSTALMYASRNNKVDVVEVLIEAGANVNDKNGYGETALMYASRSNKVDVVETLIKAGANINEKDNHDWTALMYANITNKMDVVDILVKAGANVEAKNKDNVLVPHKI